MSTITTRSGKGAGLTNAEIDANFSNLNNDKLEASSYTAADVLAKLLTVDGATSGLDADLLDGQSSAYYTDITARLGYTPLNSTAYTAADVLAKLLTVDGPLSNLDADTIDGVQLTGLVQTSRSITTAVNSGLTGGGTLGTNLALAFDTTWGDARYLLATAYTANDILTKIKTVDGSASGLDADLLDGQDSAYYTAITARLGYTPADSITTISAGTGLTGGGSLATNRTLSFDQTYGDGRYALSGHTHSYLALTGGTLTGSLSVIPASSGQVNLIGGSATLPGYVEFRTPDAIRRGYIGWGSSSQLEIKAENGWSWIVTGTASFASQVYADGRLTSRSSSQTGYASAALEAYSAAGDVWISLHAGGASAIGLQHVRNTNYVRVINSGGGWGDLYCGYFQAAGAIQSGTYVHTGNSASYYVYSYGNVYAQGDVIAYYSDERLKDKIGNINNALDKVLMLDGFRYRLNHIGQLLMDREDDTDIHVGVGAHQVRAVLPEAVTLAPFDMDQEHGGSKSGSSYLTVKYERLVPLLIEAIKELNAKVEALQ